MSDALSASPGLSPQPATETASTPVLPVPGPDPSQPDKGASEDVSALYSMPSPELTTTTATPTSPEPTSGELYTPPPPTPEQQQMLADQEMQDSLSRMEVSPDTKPPNAPGSKPDPRHDAREFAAVAKLFGDVEARVSDREVVTNPDGTQSVHTTLEVGNIGHQYTGQLLNLATLVLSDTYDAREAGQIMAILLERGVFNPDDRLSSLDRYFDVSVEELKNLPEMHRQRAEQALAGLSPELRELIAKYSREFAAQNGGGGVPTVAFLNFLLQKGLEGDQQALQAAKGVLSASLVKSTFETPELMRVKRAAVVEFVERFNNDNSYAQTYIPRPLPLATPVSGQPTQVTELAGPIPPDFEIGAPVALIYQTSTSTGRELSLSERIANANALLAEARRRAENDKDDAYQAWVQEQVERVKDLAALINSLRPRDFITEANVAAMLVGWGLAASTGVPNVPTANNFLLEHFISYTTIQELIQRAEVGTSTYQQQPGESLRPPPTLAHGSATNFQPSSR